MIDPLLFEYGISVYLIQEKVCFVMQVEREQMTIPAYTPGIKKRELTIARQISMTLSKEYTGQSLAFIGNAHGGRDHATVLNACKIVNNMLDTNDPLITIPYLRVKKNIDIFLELQKDIRNIDSQENIIFNTEK
jgi:chromosomal replication initiation ATPase DnaA